MIVSLVDGQGSEAVLCIGWADLASRTPVRPDHLFEIGFISKSLGAPALWQLATEGKIDLDAPVSRYLPLHCLPDAFIERHGFGIFGWYRIALGIVTLLVLR